MNEMTDGLLGEGGNEEGPRLVIGLSEGFVVTTLAHEAYTSRLPDQASNERLREHLRSTPLDDVSQYRLNRAVEKLGSPLLAVRPGPPKIPAALRLPCGNAGLPCLAIICCIIANSSGIGASHGNLFRTVARYRMGDLRRQIVSAASPSGSARLADKGTFAPSATETRAEMVQILINARSFIQ